MSAYSAGILPIAFKSGTDPPLFLIGKDLRCGGYSDFGGKAERQDRKNGLRSPQFTACREAFEESYGTLGSIRQLLARMRHSTDYITLRGHTINQQAYFMHVVEIPYDPSLPTAFRNALHFVQQANMQKVYVEKVDIKFVTYDELMAIQKRPGFEKTIASYAAFFNAMQSSNVHTWRHTHIKQNETDANKSKHLTSVPP
jgi:hypothetical protein